MLFLLFFCCNKAHFCFPSLSVSAVTEKLVKSAKKGATRLERKLLLWQIVSVICRLCCTKKSGVVENCVPLTDGCLCSDRNCWDVTALHD